LFLLALLITAFVKTKLTKIYIYIYIYITDTPGTAALTGQTVMLSLGFVEAVAATGKIVDLVSAYSRVLSWADASGDIEDFYRFVHGNALQLHTSPRSVYRLALYEPRQSAVSKQAHMLLDENRFPEDVLCWTNRPEARDPCRLTFAASGRVVACEYLRDHDGLVVTVTANGELCVWDGKLGGVVKSVNMSRSGSHGGHGGGVGGGGVGGGGGGEGTAVSLVRCLAVSSDHRALTAGTDKQLRVWNLNTMDLLATVSGHNEAITAVAVSNDNRYIVTAAEDFSVRVYDGRTLEVVKHDINVSSTTGWLPQSRTAAAQSQQSESDTHTDYVSAVGFRGNTHDIITGSKDGGLKIWSARDSWATRSPYQRRHDGRVNRIASAVGGLRGAADADGDGTGNNNGGSGSSNNNNNNNNNNSSNNSSNNSGGNGNNRGKGSTSRNSAGTSRESDMSRVATCGDDGRVYLFEGRTGRLVSELEGHTRAVVCCAFTPDAAAQQSAGGSDGGGAAGAIVPAGSADGGAKQRRELRAMAFNESARIVTASIDGSVRVWNARTGDAIAVYKLTMRGSMISWCSASPDGLFVASCGNTVKIYDGSPEPADKAALEDPVTLETTCRSGALSALGHGCTVEIWSTETQTKRLSFQCGSDDKDACLAVTFGHHPIAGGPEDEPRLCAAGGEGPVVVVWDLANNKRAATIQLPDGAGQVASITFSPDDGALFVGTQDGNIRVWRLSDSRPPSSQSGFAGATTSTTPASATAAASEGAAAGALITAAAAAQPAVDLARSDPDDPASASESNLNNPFRPLGAVEGTWQGHNDWVTSLVFSPQRTSLFSGAADGTLRVWTLETTRFNRAPRSAMLKGHAGPVRHLIFAPDGRRIVSASDDGTVIIWAMNPSQTWFRSAQLHGHLGAVNAVTLSPDPDGSGTLLVTASDDRTARVWDTSSGRQLEVLRGHDGPCTHAAFFGDATTVATAGGDGRVVCWDAAGSAGDVDMDDGSGGGGAGIGGGGIGGSGGGGSGGGGGGGGGGRDGIMRAAFVCSSGVATMTVRGEVVMVTAADASVYVLRLRLAGGGSPARRLQGAFAKILGRNLAMSGFMKPAAGGGGNGRGNGGDGPDAGMSTSALEYRAQHSGVKTVRRGSVLLRKGALRARKNTVRGMAPLSPITRKSSIVPASGDQPDRARPQFSVEGTSPQAAAQAATAAVAAAAAAAAAASSSSSTGGGTSGAGSGSPPGGSPGTSGSSSNRFEPMEPASPTGRQGSLHRQLLRQQHEGDDMPSPRARQPLHPQRARADTGAQGALFRPGMPGAGALGAGGLRGQIAAGGGAPKQHSPLTATAMAIAAEEEAKRAKIAEQQALVDRISARQPKPPSKGSPRAGFSPREHNYGGTLRTVDASVPQPTAPPTGAPPASGRSPRAGAAHHLPAVNTGGTRTSVVASGGGGGGGGGSSARGTGGFGRKSRR
jgi:WD40 repeat protein